jgi:hypothetical protein
MADIIYVKNLSEIRSKEKQESREEDDRRLASGEITKEQLRRENGLFAFPNVQINFEPRVRLKKNVNLLSMSEKLKE